MFGSVANTGMTVGCNALLMVGNVIGGVKILAFFAAVKAVYTFAQAVAVELLQ